MYAYVAPPVPTPGVVAVFDRPAAAARFCAADPRLWTAERHRGIRHRHRLVDVRAADRDRVRAALAAAWDRGSTALLRPGPLSPSSAAFRVRDAYARAAWRALLLAATPVRGRADLRIRLPSADLAAVAVRAARLLAVPVRLDRAGPHVVVVLDAAAAGLIRERCATPAPARPEGTTFGGRCPT